jgi:hypothetical protein
MQSGLNRLWLFVLVAGMLSVLTGIGADEPSTPELVQVNVIVRGAKSGVTPIVSAADLTVYEGDEKRPVVSWVPSKDLPGTFDLTVLVDDSLLSSVMVQLKDLAGFYPTLPSGSRVRLAYATNGGIRTAQEFTSDYASAAKALRLPVGQSAAGSSIFESVTDVLKHWPKDVNRHALLLISDGIDNSEGFEGESPDWNRNLQGAINMAQTANTSVYSIFAQGARSSGEGGPLLNDGMGCLLRLSSQTGGRSYFQSNSTPLDFAPYLRQLADDVGHLYVLTFRRLPSTKKHYQALRITTSVSEAELHAPARIFVPKD